MERFISRLVEKTEDGGCVLAVGHGAAICVYLQGFCSVEVLNAETKTRRVCFRGQEVMSGDIPAPSAFILEFEDDRIEKVTFLV